MNKNHPDYIPIKDMTPEQIWPIVRALYTDLHTVLGNFKPKSSNGVFFNMETGEMTHWIERFSDTLELIPGVTVDREAAHARHLPKRERDKFFKKREAEAAKDKENQPSE